jgi:hypothetical protein
MSVGALARFFHRFSRRVVCKFQPVSAIFQPASAVPRARVWHHLHLVHPRRCSRALSPRAWACSRRSGRALLLIYSLLRRLSVGRRARGPQLPSSGSRTAGSSLSCYQVVQVDTHAPFDKGWLVVRGLIHESACVRVLGRARSRSLGTNGAEALPQWDPSTSCPRWLLNTTFGAPSSW